MSAVTFVLRHLVVLALIASTAVALGLPWLRRLSLGTSERVGLATAVGLAVAGQLILALGLAGLLVRPAIVALVVIAHVVAWRDLRDVATAVRARAGGRAAAIGVLALLPIVLGAFYPPLGFDEALYHLPYARAF